MGCHGLDTRGHRRRSRRFGCDAWLAGVSGLAFLVVMIIGDAGDAASLGPIGHGGVERMIVYPPLLWLRALGGYLMASDTTEARR